MGTRSLTTFIDDQTKEEIVVMYRQYDGYPSGHGRDLIDFLNKMKSDNRLTYGISCLSAQVISHFKKGVGDFYLHTANTRDYGEEFVYIIYSKDNELKIKVEDAYEDKVLFDGNTDEMEKWIGYNDRPEFDITKVLTKSKYAIRQQENGFTD
mgnify:CR=1 FL=1